MFAVVFLVKRKPDMSQEAFTQYWIEEHTPFTSKVPGLREYRCFPMVGCDGEPPPYDAIAYITFDDEAAWREAESSPEFAAALGDAPNFQDTDGTEAFYAAMHTIV
jgi:uncharacterized protein (TIGR02118 family)